MADDIEAVKNAVINITASTVGTVDEPANYIVVLFNDPGLYMMIDLSCFLGRVYFDC